MSYRKNEVQQMTFSDTMFGLTPREQKALKNSWAQRNDITAAGSLIQILCQSRQNALKTERTMVRIALFGRKTQDKIDNSVEKC